MAEQMPSDAEVIENLESRVEVLEDDVEFVSKQRDEYGAVIRDLRGRLVCTLRADRSDGVTYGDGLVNGAHGLASELLAILDRDR